MTKKDGNGAIDDIVRAQEVRSQSVYLRRGLQDLLLDGENRVIVRMLGRYRAGTLDTPSLYGMVGEIQAHRNLLESLEKDIRHSEAEMKKGFRNG